MAGEEALQDGAQAGKVQLALFQFGQRQVEARHMDAAGLRVVQADTGIGFGGDPLPADLHGKGDALHADPVQGKIGGGGLAGDIGKRQGIHGELEEGQARPGNGLNVII